MPAAMASTDSGFDQHRRVAGDLLGAEAIGREHRAARRHRLHDGHADRLVQRRQQQAIGQLIQRRQILVVDPTRPVHPIG